MIEPDKWAVITDADGHRVARALFAFSRTGRLRPEVCDVWLKHDHVRVDLFKWVDTRKAWTDADVYAWYVITWSVADMRRAIAMLSKRDPQEIASFAQHLATIALGYMDSVSRAGRVLPDMPTFNIRDGGETWRQDELLGYIKAW